MNSSESALAVIQRLVLGSSYSVVKYDGSSWSFFFDGQVWLAAYAVEFPEAMSVVDQIRTKMPQVLKEHDSEDQGTAVMALKNRGIPVTDVSIVANNQLSFEFENGHSMLVKTDTAVVDWHWSFSAKDTSPYVEAIVACFHPEEKL
jgi:hypothetical protein